MDGGTSLKVPQQLIDVSKSAKNVWNILIQLGLHIGIDWLILFCVFVVDWTWLDWLSPCVWSQAGVSLCQASCMWLSQGWSGWARWPGPTTATHMAVCWCLTSLTSPPLTAWPAGRRIWIPNVDCLMAPSFPAYCWETRYVQSSKSSQFHSCTCVYTPTVSQHNMFDLCSRWDSNSGVNMNLSPTLYQLSQ